ncbi:hypothetical protein BN59_00739 [Legionella massiliensis]|uniref:Uncharacterized protein n=1 Tax=Legionella massiliensis TaxID=1034943 RepID=A0A078KQ28_9GAMM|nr:hypothetical protein [Legionella massiliensis]CDZ76470.1 hypothetical protein BN59_00739 [Legionella massiliensis]CEE12208.1 hypothetical protein BN1094_00739 [Legionella massiliensis]
MAFSRYEESLKETVLIHREIEFYELKSSIETLLSKDPSYTMDDINTIVTQLTELFQSISQAKEPNVNEHSIFQTNGSALVKILHFFPQRSWLGVMQVFHQRNYLTSLVYCEEFSLHQLEDPENEDRILDYLEEKLDLDAVKVISFFKDDKEKLFNILLKKYGNKDTPMSLTVFEELLPTIPSADLSKKVIDLFLDNYDGQFNTLRQLNALWKNCPQNKAYIMEKVRDNRLYAPEGHYTLSQFWKIAREDQQQSHQVLAARLKIASDKLEDIPLDPDTDDKLAGFEPFKELEKKANSLANEKDEDSKLKSKAINFVLEECKRLPIDMIGEYLSELSKSSNEKQSDSVKEILNILERPRGSWGWLREPVFGKSTETAELLSGFAKAIDEMPNSDLSKYF